MRYVASLALGIVLAACAPLDRTPLNWDATLATRTEGAAFYEDSRWARVGMFDSTCDVHVSVGIPSTDYDYAGNGDHVVDLNAGEVLVIGEFGASLGSGWVIEDLGAGVVDGRVLDTGAVLATDSGGECTLWWTAGGDPVTVAGGCAAMTAARDTGQAWVANGAGVHAAGPDEAGTIDPEAADLVAWDPGVNALYVAHTGLSQVRAVESDGTPRWEVDLGAPVVDLDALGDRGLATVVVAERDGTASVVFLDGWTGLAVAEQSLPEVPLSLVASPHGDRVAVDRGVALAFFRVSL